MKFYKYRTTWSSGPSTWEYIRLPEGETPKSFFREMEREHEWSEHFRGIDYRKTEPPREWLEKEIIRLETLSESVLKLSDAYRNILLHSK